MIKNRPRERQAKGNEGERLIKKGERGDSKRGRE